MGRRFEQRKDSYLDGLEKICKRRIDLWDQGRNIGKISKELLQKTLDEAIEEKIYRTLSIEDQINEDINRLRKQLGLD